MRRPLVLLAAPVLLVLLVLLTGCSDDGPAPGPARVDVDTPELRALKKDAGVAPCEPGSATPTDGGLPEVTLPCLGGGPDVDLATLEGPLVVNLWASWCGPCRTEMPILQRFHEHHGDQVAVVGVDYQDVQVEGAFDLVRSAGVTYPLLADAQGDLSGAAPFPALRGLPFWVVVDADGRVVHREFVEIRSERQLVDMVTAAGVEL